jgi:hypothetical protein
MPFTINQRLFFSGQKMYVRQETGELTRPLQIGNNWNTIRIALLCAINNGSSSTQSLGVPWAIGLCNGLGGGFAQQYTNHFVGWSNSSPPLQTYNANAGNPYYANSGLAVRKVAFTSTTAAVGGVTTNISSTDGTFARKSVIVVDINKGFTTTAYSTQTTGMANQVDVSIKEFLEVLQSPAAGGSIQGQTLVATTTQTLTGTEGAGNLDTVNIFWGATITPLEIYAMAVYRMI